MLRLALAVTLGVALLAAAAPAVDDARATNADRQVLRQADSVTDAAVRLTDRSDPVPPHLPGARRTVTVTLPDDTPSSTGLDYLAVGGTPAGVDAPDPRDGDVIVYRLDGQRPRVVHVDVDLRATADVDDSPVVLRDDATLVLRLVSHDGRPIVVVDR
ncbi:hypothetical protein ACFQH6_05150 [Halobacteriaceae archaeon GCM10025711]